MSLVETEKEAKGQRTENFKNCERKKHEFLLTITIEKKIEKFKNIYGATGVGDSNFAREIKNRKIIRIIQCIAKTQYSFSDDPKRIGDYM
ncbi:MAG: formate--tetrahydrofolate ligase [Clostridia bacterium]